MSAAIRLAALHGSSGTSNALASGRRPCDLAVDVWTRVRDVPMPSAYSDLRGDRRPWAGRWLRTWHGVVCNTWAVVMAL